MDRILILVLPALIAVGLATPLPAQRATSVVQQFTIGQGGPQEIKVQRVVSGFQGLDYESLILASITDTGTGDEVDFAASPLWRLDVRRAADLDTAGGGGPNAEWTLIPPRAADRDNGDPIRWVFAGPLWFLQPVQGGLTTVSLVQTGVDEVEMRWDNIQASEFPSIEITSGTIDAVIDVTVILSLDAQGYLEAELQVDVDNPSSGPNGAALMSAEFPALLLPKLEYGDEPDPVADGWVDDVLLTSFEGGGLIPDPVVGLEFPDVNFLDSVILDNTKQLGSPYAHHKITYPGRIPTQFYYYYDLRNVPDLSDAWAVYGGDDKMISRGTPAATRGGGTGVYMATLDPSMNVKRMHQYSVHFKKKNMPPTHVGLGIRNFFRYEATDHPLLENGQQDWTYFIGTGVASSPNPNLRRLDYPATMRVLDGDWFDAAETYRDWLETPDGSESLLRDGTGEAIPLRDRSSEALLVQDRIPDPYLWMAAILGTGETGPNGFDAASQDPVGNELFLSTGDNYSDYVKEYVNWLRAGSSAFNGTPWFALGHGEGMQDETGVGLAIKSSGTDEENRLPRQGLVDFHRDMRTEDATGNWIGAILMTSNRDTGRSEGGLSFDHIAHSERGVAHSTSQGEQTSYARGTMVGSTTELLREHLDLFMDVGTGDSQLDLLFLSGQGAETKPDASLWFFSDPTQEHAYGGNDWSDGLDQLYRNVRELSPIVSTPSANLYAGCERLNEGTMRHVFSLGPSHGHPISAGSDDNVFTGPGPQKALFEPVPVIPTLFHEYNLLRGRLTSHALYALQGVAKPIGGFPDAPLPGPEEYRRSQRLVSHRLATEILHHGRVPTVFVSGDRAGLDWTFSDRVGLGPDDPANASFAAGEPMWFMRQLLRTRMTAQAFLITGRRERDVQLSEDPSNTTGWFASEIEARQHGIDGRDELITIRNFDELSIPRLVHGTWGVRGGVDTPAGLVRILIVAANPSQDDGATNFDTTYNISFDPSLWNLEPGQYVLRAHRYDWSDPVPYPGTDPVFNHDDTFVQHSPRTLTGQGVHFWSISPVAAAASAPLGLEVMDRKDPVRSGRYALYEMAVTNNDRFTREAISIEGSLPAGTQFVRAEGVTTANLQGDRVLFAPLSSLAPGEKATWRVLVRTVGAGDILFRAKMQATRYSPIELVETTRVD